MKNIKQESLMFYKEHVSARDTALENIDHSLQHAISSEGHVKFPQMTQKAKDLLKRNGFKQEHPDIDSVYYKRGDEGEPYIRVYTLVAVANRPNQNRRIYDDSALQTMGFMNPKKPASSDFQKGALVGELDHPNMSVFQSPNQKENTMNKLNRLAFKAMDRAAIKIIHFEIVGNALYSVFETLGTTKGIEVARMYRQNRMPISISTRCLFEMNRQPKYDHNQMRLISGDDIRMVTYDVVLSPSVADATTVNPSLFSCDVRGDEIRPMGAQENANEITRELANRFSSDTQEIKISINESVSGTEIYVDEKIVESIQLGDSVVKLESEKMKDHQVKRLFMRSL